MDINTHIRRALHSLQSKWYIAQYRFPGNYKRIYHYHIRKSAGTSLNSAFWRLANLDLKEMGRRSRVCKNGFIFVRHNPVLINQGNYFYANSHNPAYRVSLPSKTFTITILRDPLKRLISYYRYLNYVKFEPLASQTEPYYQEVLKQADILGQSFEVFLQNIPKRDLLNQLYMFSKTYDGHEALETILQCNAVCFTETFSQDLSTLNERLSLSLQERRDRSFKLEVQIHPSEIEQAREMLNEECKLFQQVQSKLRPTVS